MKLHEIVPAETERKTRKRRGRGPGSGRGCTSGKGNKGQNARSGGGTRPGFEGGQMPLARRVPKRGFSNIHRVEYDVVNLETLETQFPEQEEITLDQLRQLCGRGRPIKILGRGDCRRKMRITAHKFSRTAAEKIVQAGGEANSLEG